jgi:hypothetical protein
MPVNPPLDGNRPLSADMQQEVTAIAAEALGNMHYLSPPIVGNSGLPADMTLEAMAIVGNSDLSQ